MGKSTKDLLKRMDANIELIMKHLKINSSPAVKNKPETKKLQQSSPLPAKSKARTKQKK